MKCELCGQAVRVYAGKEGTNSYEPAEAESLRAALDVAVKGLKAAKRWSPIGAFLQGWGHDPHCECAVCGALNKIKELTK